MRTIPRTFLAALGLLGLVSCRRADPPPDATWNGDSGGETGNDDSSATDSSPEESDSGGDSGSESGGESDSGRDSDTGMSCEGREPRQAFLNLNGGRHGYSQRLSTTLCWLETCGQPPRLAGLVNGTEVRKEFHISGDPHAEPPTPQCWEVVFDFDSAAAHGATTTVDIVGTSPELRLSYPNAGLHLALTSPEAPVVPGQVLTLTVPKGGSVAKPGIARWAEPKTGQTRAKPVEVVGDHLETSVPLDLSPGPWELQAQAPVYLPVDCSIDACAVLDVVDVTATVPVQAALSR